MAVNQSPVASCHTPHPTMPCYIPLFRECLAQECPTKEPCRKNVCRKPGDSVANLCRGMACYKPSVFDSQPYATTLPRVNGLCAPGGSGTLSKYTYIDLNYRTPPVITSLNLLPRTPLTVQVVCTTSCLYHPRNGAEVDSVSSCEAGDCGGGSDCLSRIPVQEVNQAA